jgi:hypothetical protein
MPGSFWLIIALSVPLKLCSAQTTFWSYFLDYLPPGWTQNLFTFGPDGALFHDSGFFYPSAQGNDPLAVYLQSQTVIIPAGVDSVVLLTSQNAVLETGASGPGYAGASVTVYASVNGVSTQLWQLESYASGGQSDSTASNENLCLTLPPVAEGDAVYIKYDPFMYGYMGTVWITWLLWDSELIGYPGLSLTPRTWGSIKTWF